MAKKKKSFFKKVWDVGKKVVAAIAAAPAALIMAGKTIATMGSTITNSATALKVFKFGTQVSNLGTKIAKITGQAAVDSYKFVAPKVAAGAKAVGRNVPGGTLVPKVGKFAKSLLSKGNALMRGVWNLGVKVGLPLAAAGVISDLTHMTIDTVSGIRGNQEAMRNIRENAPILGQPAKEYFTKLAGALTGRYTRKTRGPEFVEKVKDKAEDVLDKLKENALDVIRKEVK